MKTLIYLILFISLASCSTNELIYQSNVALNFSYDLDHNKSNFPIDSNYYQNLLQEGYLDECAKLEAYGMNDLILERTLPNRCHKQYIRFRSINAYKLADTVFVVFSTIKNKEEARRSSKLLFIKIHDEGYDIDLVHSGSLYREIHHIDGTTSREPAKISKVKVKRLKIDKSHYHEGDTIAGELKVKSIIACKRRGNTTETITGNFRAVLKSPKGSCEGIFSYID